MTAPALQLTDVKRHFPVKRGLFGSAGAVKAVDGVSLTVAKGETVALVGESGCGKSTLGRIALRLIEPTAGSVRVNGAELTALSPADLRKARRAMQIVFQDPFASLNPRMSVFDILAEPILLHGLAQGPALEARVHALLGLVGLAPHQAERFPHEFSGGQRQRIGVARALATNPDLVVCDEPVSALDVSIQAQVVNLLQDLQARFGLAYLFIAHDLAVVKHIADRVAVMYLGKIVELAPKAALYATPRHPYTQALLAAAPRPDPTLVAAERVILQGDPPSPLKPPPGCAFHPRCAFAVERCKAETPMFRDIAGTAVACHRASEIAPPAVQAAPRQQPALAKRLDILAGAKARPHSPT
jgi:oligopeptide transport system ATP-binding protein